MPYGELRGGTDGTSAITRAVYPKSGSTITIADGDMMGHYDNLLAGVLAGDILLFRGWFGDGANQNVKLLCQEADFVRKAAGSADGAPLDKALADAEPLVRYKALAGVKPSDANAVAAVIAATDGEKNWVVLKKMVAVLGDSARPAALDALARILKDKSLKMDYFAAVALGKFGPAASGKLAEMLNEADPAMAAKALTAMASYEDPNAVAAILPLADSNNATLRIAAIKALGMQHVDASVDKLIALLDSNNPAVVSAAAGSLGKLKAARAVKPLVEAINRVVARKMDNNVRSAVGDALEAVTGKQFGPYEQQWKRALEAGKLDSAGASPSH